MTIVNSQGYLKPRWKNEIYLVKNYRDNKFMVDLRKVLFPKEMLGKRVRFKVEIVED